MSAKPSAGEPEAVRDERARLTNGPVFDETELRQRRADSIWVGMGIHMPAKSGGKGRRHHRKHKHNRNGHLKDGQVPNGGTLEEDRRILPPGARVQFLLKENEEDENADSVEIHRLFTEMEELHEQEWRETARWIKFEEDVEEGGNRWSKPHVATLSLHSLFELRSCLMNGCVVLDMEAADLSQIVDIMLDKMIASKQLSETIRDEVRDVLLKRHTHQFEYQKGTAHRDNSQAGGTGFLNTVRSFADIGRNFSHARNLQHQESQLGTLEAGGMEGGVQKKDSLVTKGGLQTLTLPDASGAPGLLHESSSAALDGSKLRSNKSFSNILLGKISTLASVDENMEAHGNQHFMKKIPAGAEATNVLIGEVDFLDHHVSAFIRLKNSVLLGDLTEVPINTRFVFILLGPKGHGPQFKEIGRAVATLMSDEVFHEIAYKAHKKLDLLDGVDEFLDQVTVLPPGEWDPNIRIEPPQNIPSQEKRKVAPDPVKEEPEEEGGHGADPTLKRTGRLFGGLVMDVKRKLPWLKSDFLDALNLQCVAATFFMYFAMLAPVVTFGGLLEEATGRNMGAIENLLSAAICGSIYCMFAGQPLTIIGATGPVLVFEKIIFSICGDWLDFLCLRFWIGLWIAAILLFMVATDLSCLVTYITRFTEECFSCLISLIFIVEAIKKLFDLLLEQTKVGVLTRDNMGTDSVYCLCSNNQSNNANYTWEWVEGMVAKKHITRNISTLPWLSPAKYLDKNGNWSTWYVVDYTTIPLTQCERFMGQLEGNGCQHMYDIFLMSVVLALGTFAIASGLKSFRNTFFFPTKIRQIVSDFAVMIAILLMVAFDYFMEVSTPKLNVPDKLQPTKYPDRDWFVHPFINPWWTCVIAVLPAMFGSILIFMDQQITAVIVNRKENKFKKGGGYHLDLFVLSILIILCAGMGIPYFVAATVMALSHVNSVKEESESAAPGEKPVFIGCKEQRVTGILTFVLLGLSIVASPVLKIIPMPVLYGVFLYMGVSSLRGVQLVDRVLLLFNPMKYQPDYIYLRHVQIRKVHLFTLFQVGCLASLWVIKSIKITSIVFPIMLVVMVGVRKLMEMWFFSKQELKYLDDLMPEFTLRNREDSQKAREEKERLRMQDFEGGTLTPVKTEANLHIPLASGNVMKIPLASIDKGRLPHHMNISDEVNKSGLWKHIESQSSLTEQEEGPPKRKKTAELLPIEIPESDEEFDGVTIRIDRASPAPKERSSSPKNESTVPLLPKSSGGKSDSDKAESSV